MRKHSLAALLIWAVLFARAPPARAALDVPLSLSSRPGAAYTIYLDFGGFDFSGNWGNDPSYVPGFTPAYDIDGNAAAFSAAELANIKQVWSRASEKYSSFNVNVTTIDPAVAGGQAADDLARQNYYDAQAKMMHTVIGGDSSWYPSGPAGGLSYAGVTGHAVVGSNGFHTNWTFSNVTATSSTNFHFLGDEPAHENGHGFGLYHQSVFNGNTLVNEYDPGTGVGPGTKAPIMGNSYAQSPPGSGNFAERGVWRIGTADSTDAGGPPITQNDIAVFLNPSTNPGLAIIDDGIGHTRPTATALPLVGGAIDFSSAIGVITPVGATSSSGAANYTADFWSFSTAGGPVTMTANAGRQSIAPGVPDPGATLDCTLQILDINGAVVTASATASLSESITTNLAAGTYYAEVSSAADPTGSGYFDIGSYFLTGSVAAVPEPSSLLLTVVGSMLILVRRRRLAQRD